MPVVSRHVNVSWLAQVTAAHAEDLAQLRADGARERDELRAAPESGAQVLEESRGELRGRAERAERGLDAARSERGLDAARAELARVRQEPRAANVGVSGRSGRFAACRRVTADPNVCRPAASVSISL